jgi:hypothetical protein
LSALAVMWATMVSFDMENTFAIRFQNNAA